MTDEYFEPDDPMSEAAAFRHGPSEKPGRKCQEAPDDVTLHVRLDRGTFEELLKIADKANHEIEAYARRLFKKDIKDAQRAAAIRFIAEHHAEIAEMLRCNHWPGQPRCEVCAVWEK